MLPILFIALLSLPNLPLTEAVVSEFECPPPQQCNNNVLVMTCEISNIGLVWRINKYSYETLFTAVHSAGSTDIDGPFKAALIKSDPTVYISTLSIEVDPSMDGIEVECIDGLNGFSESCVLDVITYPRAPLALTITHISDTSLNLTWLPPANTGGTNIEISNYMIAIYSTNHTDFNCAEDQCDVTANSTMITNLKNTAKYNISISPINCIGVGEASDTLQIIPGKSPIIVFPADPAFIALNFTSIKIYWNTINNSIGKVNNYILNITQVDNNNEVNEIIDGTSKSYVITNLVQGVKYSYTIIATDYNNRYGITSPSVEFIVDTPAAVNYLNCSIVMKPNQPAKILIISQYLDSVRPPIQGYIIYHNTTINGDTTSIFVPDNRSLISYEIEIPSEFLSDRFEVSIAIVNALGEGEKVTSIVEAELITPAEIFSSSPIPTFVAMETVIDLGNYITSISNNPTVSNRENETGVGTSNSSSYIIASVVITTSIAILLVVISLVMLIVVLHKYY